MSDIHSGNFRYALRNFTECKFVRQNHRLRFCSDCGIKSSDINVFMLLFVYHAVTALIINARIGNSAIEKLQSLCGELALQLVHGIIRKFRFSFCWIIVNKEDKKL